MTPNRAAAVAEQKPGHCAICERPIHFGPRGMPGKYTCGRRACVRAWQTICIQDIRAELKAAGESIDRAEQEIG